MGYGPEGEFDHGGRVIGAFLYDSYDIKAPRMLKKSDERYSCHIGMILYLLDFMGKSNFTKK